MSGRLTENSEYEIMAKKTILFFSKEISESSIAHTFLLIGLDFLIGPSYRVKLVGRENEDSLKKMINTLNSNYLPNVVVELKLLDRIKTGKKRNGEKAIAHICSNLNCKSPTDNADQMLKVLESKWN